MAKEFYGVFHFPKAVGAHSNSSAKGRRACIC